MSVEIKLSFSSVPEMLAFFGGKELTPISLAPIAQATVELPKPAESSADKKRPGRPRKEQASPAQPEVAVGNTGSAASDAPSGSTPAEGSTGSNAEEEAEVAGNDASEPAASSAPVTIDDARAALTKLNAAKGLEVAKEALTKFGASRMADLKEADYAAFVAHCEVVGA